MAETLGSLVDKLSIKSIREFYLKQMIASKKSKFTKKQLKEKLLVLETQKKLLIKEVEEFVIEATRRKIILKDEKLKLYNKPQAIGKIGRVNSLSKAIDGLSKKNMELWQLEDQARREDVPLSYIGKTKRKIDVANQQRNDLIDKIDEFFSEKIKKRKKK